MVSVRYPSKKKLEEMNKKLKNIEGALMVVPKASPAEKFRWDLCQNLVKYMVEKDLSQVEFAKRVQFTRVLPIVNNWDCAP